MQVYKITNLINGKIYIGKDTSSDINYYGSGTLIKRSIKKYGKENFKKEIIEECNNNDELCQKEKYWINFYNTTDLNIGYNITKGGEGGDTLSNNPKIDVIKKKISNIRRGKKYEDFLPIEKVKIYKEKLAANMKKRLKGKKLEEIYGIEKAKNIKEKLSLSQIKRFEKLPKNIKVKLTKDEIEQRKFDRLKAKLENTYDIKILKKYYFRYKRRNNIEFFIQAVGEKKYNKIIDELNKPYKHEKKSIDKIIQDKIKKFLKRKNQLCKFLLENNEKTRNDFYKNLSSKEISSRVNIFLNGKLSYLVTEEEKKLIRKKPKKKYKLSEEKLKKLKTKLGKPILIDNIEYISASEASKILNIDRGTIRFRLKNDNYQNYKYL